MFRIKLNNLHIFFDEIKQIRIKTSVIRYRNHSGQFRFMKYVPAFLDAVESPSSYPCHSLGQWVSQWFIVSDLEIAVASPSFVSLLNTSRLKITWGKGGVPAMETLGQLIFALSPVNLMETDLRIFVDCFRTFWQRWERKQGLKLFTLL